MLQTKICEGVDLKDLERRINDFLSESKCDDAKIIYYLTQFCAVIEYNKHNPKLMCVDCRFYDPNGDQHRKAYGVCHWCGERVRFSNETCEHFRDMRE